ncbi:MAG: diguanylate cyclase [Rhodocyclaceae bacterium]|nr:diguanylate cyclase [Rhodocyclaceae bacterium]
MSTREQNERLLREHQAIFENAAIGIVYSCGHRIERCNRRIAEIFGYEVEELVGQEAAILYASTDDYVRLRHAARADLLAGRTFDGNAEMRRKDGTAVHVHISGRLVDSAAAEPAVVWTIENITEKREMLQRLEMAQRVFDSSSEAIVVTDADNRIVSVNRAFESISGFSADEAMGRNPGSFKSGRHDTGFYQAMWRSLRDQGRWQGEVWDRRKDGSIYPKLACIDVVRDPASGKIVNYVAVFSDFSERKASEEQVSYLAHHDPLTGLSNRLALNLHLGHQLAVARRNGTRVALLFIDLDGFKPVNDRHGHAEGDSLLVSLAARLRQQARESDLVVRLGGDEFVIVMEGGFTDHDLAAIAADLVAAVAEPCPLAAGMVRVSCSIGIACAPPDGDTAELLLSCADAAMYRAKAAGSGRYMFFADGAADVQQEE